MNDQKPKSNETAQFSIHKPVLKVVGLGGGGGNAVNRMIEAGVEGVEFINANTDHQVLKKSLAPTNIQLGPKKTRGLGAGGQPKVGREAAIESRNELAAAMRGADMVFLTAGMGGGTGTGSIPVAAEIARKLGAVTIAVVTTPFGFESGQRMRNANSGIQELQRQTDTLITIPNERLVEMGRKDLTLDMAFRMADDVLRQAVQGITELITEPGIINVDFAHIKAHMKMGGGALMSMGYGEGENRAADAVHMALNHPLLDAIPVEQATGVIANFTGANLTLFEINQTMSAFHTQLGPKADVVWGVSSDARLRGRAQVILVLTGLGATTLEEAMMGTGRSVSRQTAEPDLKAQPRQLPIDKGRDTHSEWVDTEMAASLAYSSQYAGSEHADEPPLWQQGPPEAPSRGADTGSQRRYRFDTDKLDIPAFMRQGRFGRAELED